MTPLYGHTSFETAYEVADYPYGFRLRCKIRYWIESHPKRGFRFVSRTTNPKRPGEHWNAPKASTYVEIAMALYLDDVGHVQCDRLSHYSDHNEAQAFLARFPQAELSKLRDFAKVRALVARRFADGTGYMTLNGARVPRTDEQRAADALEAEQWAKVAA